jgi:2-polyprenyl-3-methyl-5-hydroxy-6-metoxy-1,4-benzoquinol methylase
VSPALIRRLKRFLPPVVGDRIGRAAAFAGDADGDIDSIATHHPEFTEFIAARRDIAPNAALELVKRAEAQFKGGWGGQDYRHFTERALETFRPLYDETTDAELIRTYQFHGPADFLRMLGYRVPSEHDVGVIVAALAGRSEIGIVDYGCGLAHRTLAVARCLSKRGARVQLTLVDIRRELHFEFLEFLCRKHGIEHDFIEITADQLYPQLPPHDYCDNVSVLEHVREPLRVIENTHAALRPGGVFLAAIEDEIEEMMHISPNLKAVRERLDSLGYRRIAEYSNVPLLQKPA